MENRTVKKATKGNVFAFDEIVNEIKIKAYKIAICYLQNERDALDVISNSMFFAYKNIKKLKHYDCFSTWYIRIVINECKKILNYRMITVNSNDIENQIKYENETSDIDLLNQLEALPEQDRIIIYLKYYQGFSMKEISEILNLSENTVKIKLNKRVDSMGLDLFYEEKITNEK